MRLLLPGLHPDGGRDSGIWQGVHGRGAAEAPLRPPLPLYGVREYPPGGEEDHVQAAGEGTAPVTPKRRDAMRPAALWFLVACFFTVRLPVGFKPLHDVLHGLRAEDIGRPDAPGPVLELRHVLQVQRQTVGPG